MSTRWQSPLYSNDTMFDYKLQVLVSYRCVTIYHKHQKTL